MLRILEKLSFKISKVLGRQRGKKFADGIEIIVGKFHRNLNNVNFNIKTNGELRALTALSTFNLKVIFDVGANTGEWSNIVSEINPNALIHAFELVPATYKKLSTNTKNLKNIILNDFGLSKNQKVF